MTSSLSFILWLVVLNLIGAGLFFYVKKLAESSTLLNSFRIFLLSYLCWINPLLLIRIIPSDNAAIDYCARLIIAGGCFFVARFGTFTLQFARPIELRTKRFRLFMLNFIFLAFAALLGYVEAGVVVGPGELLAPIPGPLFPYFSLSMCAFGSYFILASIIGYKNIQDEFLRLQLRTILLTCVPAFLLGLLTNAIVPGLTGDFRLTPTGGLWILLFFLGVTHVLVSGRLLVLAQHLNKIDSSLKAEYSQTYFLGLERVFRYLHFRRNNPVKASSQTFKLIWSENSNVDVVIHREENPADQKPSTLNAESMDELFASLSYDNMKLSAVSLLAGNSSHLLNTYTDNPLSYEKEHGSGSDGTKYQKTSKHVTLAHYWDLIETDIAKRKASHGLSLFAFSKERRKLLDRLAVGRSSNATLLFIGASGSGKKYCAQQVEGSRSAPLALQTVPLSAFSDSTIAPNSELRNFGISCHPHKRLIVPDIDSFSSSSPQCTSKLYSKLVSSQDIYYLTASKSILELSEQPPFQIVKLFFSSAVFVPSICECPEDLPFFIAAFLRRLQGSFSTEFKYISQEVLDYCAEQLWPGNFYELERFLVENVTRSSGSCLELHTTTVQPFKNLNVAEMIKNLSVEYRAKRG